MKYINILIMMFLTSYLFGQKLDDSTEKYFTLSSNNSQEEANYESCIISNDKESNIVIMFVEDSVTNASDTSKLVKKKILRNYGDFRLSMLMWEANITINGTNLVVPELFVKILKPNESFKVLYKYKSNHVNILSHLLIIREDQLKSIGFSNFIESVNEYQFDFPYNSICLTNEELNTFINRGNLR